MAQPFHSSLAVPVSGGSLHVGVAGPPPGTPGVPVVLAVHGITGSHRSWAPAARHLHELVAGSRLAVLDIRNPGVEIDVAFTAELKPDQAVAVGAMLSHDDGVLVAPPGSGKTVMACAIIAERATSTLVLVDRKALAEQWRTQVGTLLGIKPGQVGGALCYAVLRGR